jgi:hypothetical protein
MVQKLLAATVLMVAVGASAQTTRDSAYFTISKVQVKELNRTEAEAAVAASPLADRTFANTPGLSVAGCDQSGSGRLFQATVATPAAEPSLLDDLRTISEDLDGTEVVLDQIINVGKKVWDLIDQGKPVVNVSSNVATALPQGAKCWLDLQRWQAPKYKAYEVTYKNAYGVTVVDIAYRIVYLAGGDVNGKGQYIGYATVEPLKVRVLWGFHVNLAATVPTVYNMGTKEDPVAGMNMQVKWSVDGVMSLVHDESTRSYFLNGRGDFREM